MSAKNGKARAPKQRKIDPEAEKVKIQGHLQVLEQREAALTQEMAGVRAARQQLVGRLRLIQEVTGEVPPLADPILPEEVEEEPAEA